MIDLIITGRNISVASLSNAWPGMQVTCFYEGADTRIQWHPDSPIPSKTEAEVLTAQDAYDLLLPWDRLRTERNALLVSSDWTQYNDSPLDEAKAEWATYRQELRDLPANTDDPANPTWPDAP